MRIQFINDKSGVFKTFFKRTPARKRGLCNYYHMSEKVKFTDED